MRRLWLLCLAGLLVASSARADVWDVGADNDNGSGTDNELTHGTRQVHDLGALAGPVADEDWYRLYIPAYTSWEVLLDGTTGDICAGGGAGVELQLLESDGVTQSYGGVGVSPFNCARSINVTNLDITTAGATQTFVRVRGVDCTTNCDAADQYSIQARETTLYAPRFNNSATQVTVCIVQNGDDIANEVQFIYFDGAGTLLAQVADFLQPHQTRVVNTSGIAALVGKSGSLMVMNSARYGRMQGKCVAVEPATGFTFDTAMLLRQD